MSSNPERGGGEEVRQSISYLDLLELSEIIPDMEPCPKCGCPRGHRPGCPEYEGPEPQGDYEDVFCMDGQVIQLSSDQVLQLIEIGYIAHHIKEEHVMNQYFTAITLNGVYHLASGSKAEMEEILATLQKASTEPKSTE